MAAVVGGGMDERHGELPLLVAEVVVLVGADEVDMPQLGLFRGDSAAADGRRGDDGVVLPSERIFGKVKFVFILVNYQ